MKPEALDLLDRRFPAKRALITGGASGLGLATAEWLARRAWRVGLVDLSAERLASAASRLRELGASEVCTAVADVADDASVKTAIDGCADRWGGLDYALNAAGVASAGYFLDTPHDDWHWLMGINLFGVVSSCRAELPHMLAGGGGLIVNVASAAGFASSAGMSPYNVSKAGVISLSETLDQEVRERGVQVTAAMPGFFRTNLLDTARASADELAVARKIMNASNLEASPVALEILLRAARGERYVVLPTQYRYLWRFKRFLPAVFQRFMVRFRNQAEQRMLARQKQREAGGG
ncbi:MAG: SDR family NAD(P)-dependent oxidoreductase [Steroidobacteraceae bacterium]